MHVEYNAFLSILGRSFPSEKKAVQKLPTKRRKEGEEKREVSEVR